MSNETGAPAPGTTRRYRPGRVTRVKSACRIPSSLESAQLRGAEREPRSTVSPRSAETTAKDDPVAPTTTAIFGADGMKPIWLRRIAAVEGAVPCPAAIGATHASESAASAATRLLIPSQVQGSALLRR